ncbi:hypothetical protein QQ045_025733 [Rhodiola kirilowii]
MASYCTKIFYILGLISLLISIPIIISGINMRRDSQSKCDTDIYPHMLVEGVSMLVLTLIALIGIAGRIKFFIRLFIVLTAFEFLYIIFSSTIGYHTMYTEQGREAHYHDEYSLEHFREGVKNRYLNDVAWAGHKVCLKKNNLCSEKYDSKLTSWRVTNPVRYACCGPPIHCRYNYMNGKGFMVPETGLASEDLDCIKYDNHADRKCFDCDICKAAFLAVEVGDMQRLNVAIIVVNIMFIVQLMMACAAAEAMESIEDDEINNPMY